MKPKQYVLELVLVLVFAIMLQVVLSFFYLVDFSSRAYVQYEDYSSFNLKTTVSKLQTEINDAQKRVDSSTITQIDQDIYMEGFDIICSINDKKVESAIYKDNTIIDLTLSFNYYQDLTTEKVTVASLDLIASSSAISLPSDIYAVFNKSIGENHILYFYSLQPSVNTLLETGFQNIILARRDNVAIYSSNVKYNNINLLNSFNINIVDTNALDVFQTTVNNDNITVAVIPFGYNSAKMLGFISSNTIKTYVKSSTSKLVAILAVLLAISLLALISCILLFIKRYKNLNIFSGVYPKHFVVYINNSGKVVFANQSFRRKFKDTKNVIMALENSTISDALISNKSFPVTLQTLDGGVGYINFIAVKVFFAYKLIGGDSTLLINKLNKYKEISETDELTTLNNRYQFKTSYNAIQEGGIVCFNLQNINKFEVMFGKTFYDAIIREYARLISTETAEYGQTFFANGIYVLLVKQDEYVKIVKDIDKLMKRFGLPINILGNVINVDCRAGLVEKISDISSEEILEFGSLALEQASHLLRVKYSVYNHSQKVSVNLAKDDIISQMINNDELQVFYQPQYSLKEKRIIGFEALCRLKNNDISIGKFIEKAEHSGHMINLGNFIYDNALKFAKQVSKYNVSISINISPIQLLQTGFATTFLEKYHQYNLTKGQVCIEVTESFIMTDLEEMVEKLKILQNAGIDIHLDDFGIAYSSMLYLKKLPINAIKFDKEFIRDIIDDKYSKTIVSKLITICKELDLQSLAEGVETLAQRKQLEKFGCDIIQGYLIGRAVNKEKAITMLKEDSPNNYDNKEVIQEDISTDKVSKTSVAKEVIQEDISTIKDSKASNIIE